MIEEIPQDVADALNHAAGLVNDWARAKGWWDKERNKGELIALMHSELSECLEALRKGNPPDDKVPHLSGEVAELADVIIRILDYCGGYGLDIGAAVRDKHLYNCGRPIRHGKAF